MEMQERIIMESIASLRREGLRFSVDAVAERLNISKKTVYKYFPDKESLAVALYQRFYADEKAQMLKLAEDGSTAARFQMLSLYWEAKSMTSPGIFNKYKLNEALRTCTEAENGNLSEMLFSSLPNTLAEEEKTVLRFLVNAALEKLCNEKTAPDGVMEKLVQIVWKSE